MHFVVYLGGSNLPPSSDTKIRVPAAEKIAHPDWNPADMSNDIAILVLERMLTKEETSGRTIKNMHFGSALKKLFHFQHLFLLFDCRLSAWRVRLWRTKG
jgi:Trypsin